MYKGIIILIIILSISGILKNMSGLTDSINRGFQIWEDPLAVRKQVKAIQSTPQSNPIGEGISLSDIQNQLSSQSSSYSTPLRDTFTARDISNGYVKPTNNNKTTNNTKDTSQQDAKNAKLASQIKDSFSSTIDNYKKQISGLPGQQQDSMQQIGNLADSQTNSITDALNAALAKYTGYRGEVADNQKQTLQGLADNTRNLFQAGNNYLGTLGAGNSSATGMYSAALTQQANKQRADVQNQTNKQYNDLNVSEQDTHNQFQQSIDQIKTWKATQETTIISQYQDLKRQLESAYAGAKDNQKGAIANLSMQLANQAQASLSNIGQVASNLHNQLSQGLNTQMGTTQGLVNGVQQNANNYQVGQIVTQDIAGMPNVSQNQDGSYVDNSTGTVFGKKDDGTYQVISI